MGCVIDRGICAGCDALNRLGGLAKNIYLLNWEADDGTRVTATRDDVNCVVSDITPPDACIYEFCSRKDSHSANWTYVINEGAPTFIQHNVIMKVYATDPCEREFFNQLSNSTVVAIVETRNEEFLIYGLKNGLTVSEGTQDYGNVAGTDIGAIVTLTGEEVEVPVVLDAGDYASTLALIKGLVCPNP